MHKSKYFNEGKNKARGQVYKHFRDVWHNFITTAIFPYISGNYIRALSVLSDNGGILMKLKRARVQH